MICIWASQPDNSERIYDSQALVNIDRTPSNQLCAILEKNIKSSDVALL